MLDVEVIPPMIQAIDHSQSSGKVADSRAIPSSFIKTDSRQAGSVSAAHRPGSGLRRKWNTLRYVLLGTGAYAPPVGKFKI